MRAAPLGGSFVSAMGVNENKELVLGLYKDGYPNGPSGLGRFFGSGYVDHAGWGDLRRLEAGLSAFKQAYPNVEWKVEDMIAEGDKVAVRSSVKILSAVGAVNTVSSVSIFRIANGKIVETWGHGDPLFRVNSAQQTG